MVVIGAGVAGLPAAITARDNGASVIIVDENFDIGGRGMLSGGRVQVGGGHALQQKLGIKDTPDMIFNDWVRFDHSESRFSDRDLIRVFADENVATYDFLIENGVEFIEKPIRSPDASTVDRIFVTKEWHIPSQVIAPRRNRNGSGLVRRLEESARKKGVQIFLKHKMTLDRAREAQCWPCARHHHRRRQQPGQNRARKGVIIATGGHTGNVNFRRIFDPRLTEEYQQACEPYVHQGADGELAAMDIGASLWSTANQTCRRRGPDHQDAPHRLPLGLLVVGLRARQPDVPAGARHRPHGARLAEHDFRQPERSALLERGRRLARILRCGMAYNGDKPKLNGGGPIWAIFDADAVEREKWKPAPPHVDPDGYFYSADTIAELASKINNPYQKQPIPAPRCRRR